MAGIFVVSRPTGLRQSAPRETPFGPFDGSADPARPTDERARRFDKTWLTPPDGGWSWGGSLLLLGLLLQPYLLVLVVDLPLRQKLGTAGLMSFFLINIAILACAVILKYDWRISRRATTGWLSATLAFVAVQNIPFALLGISGSAYTAYAMTIGITQVPVALVLLGFTVLATSPTRAPLRNPLPVGIGLGALVAAVRLLLVHNDLDPTLDLSGGWRAALVAANLIVIAAVVARLLRARIMPPWVRGRVAILIVCLTFAKLLHQGAQTTTPSPVAIVVGSVGAVVLCGTAVAMFRQTLADNSRRLVSLAHRAATAEANVRHGKEKMHELHATIAGVAQASRLLIQIDAPLGPKRARLERMLDSEMARLERMLSERGTQPVTEVALDDVLQPLVDAQRTIGCRVDHEPSGQRVLGRGDDIAEAVHILLHNASRHAPGAPTCVTAARVGDTVEIRVADQGPGVPAAMRESLFQWGTRRPGSPGQGIGLQLARRLMLEQDGNLRLEPDDGHSGAVFVMTLPAAPEEKW